MGEIFVGCKEEHSEIIKHKNYQISNYKEIQQNQKIAIEKQKIKIKKQFSDNQKQEQTIENQRSEIYKHKREQQKHLQTIKGQEILINRSNIKNEELEIQNNELNESLNAITEENKEIKKRLKKIEKQNLILNDNYKEEIKRIEEKYKEELQKKLDEHSKKVYNDLNNKKTTISKNERQIAKLNKQLNELQNKDKENMKLNEEYQKKIKDLEEDYHKQIEELKNQIDKEKDEKKKNEFIEKRRIRNLRYSFSSKINNIKLEKIKSIKKNFDKNFCLIVNFKSNKNNALNLIIDSIKNEKILEIINFFLDSFMNTFKNNIKDIEHLNILLVGPTGVGKTTLINSLLKINLKTGIGKPQTEKIESYTSEEISILRLFDSKGIEKEPTAGIDITFEEISNFIKSQKDPDYYIHCIWYCWTGTRLENIELLTLKKLSKQYTLEDLPIIIVYTNAIKPEKIEGAKKYIKDMEIDNDFVEILSLDEKVGFGNNATIIPSYGLDKLIELSIKKAKSAIHSSCYEGLLKGINTEIEIKIKNLVNIIKDKLRIKIEEIISNIGKTIDRQNLQNEIIKVMVDLIYYFFFLSPDITVDPNDYKANIESFDLKYQITDVTLSKIEEFVVQYFNDFIDIYKINYQNLIELYKNELMQEIDKFRFNFIIENGKLFEMPKTEKLEKEIKEFIDMNISETAEIIAFKNFIRNITSPLVEQFAIEFEKLYKKVMEQKKFKDKALKILENSFDKIEQKIKQYNEEENKKKQESNPELNKKDESIVILNYGGLSDGDIDSILKDYDEFDEQSKENQEEKKS